MLFNNFMYFDTVKDFIAPSEAKEFIEKRLKELTDSEKKEIGLATNTSVYENFISPNIKVNVESKLSLSISPTRGEISTKSIGSVRFDDPNMYWDLVNAVRMARDPYEAVYKAIKDYFVSKRVDKKPDKKLKKRELIFKRFSYNDNIPVSIKKISKAKLARASEKAVAVHNMFKFLGIESDCVINGYAVVNGKGGPHSFNVIYPEGRDKYAIIYDTSNECNADYPVMYYLNEEKKQGLFENKEVSLNSDNVTAAFFTTLNYKAYFLEPGTDTYMIFKDGAPETIIAYEHPAIAKKLNLVRKEEK